MEGPDRYPYHLRRSLLYQFLFGRTQFTFKAGLFSATVTAFAVESYQWLDETPANTLARLQLRALLNATHDPEMDRMAPATFTVTQESIYINALWFASLTLALAAVVVSILCKQWLYEYQRYENYTIKESLLIHGLRYRGLQAWRVPEIIGTLPILLQTALVLFLVGLLVLLGPLQPTVAGIVTAIVGMIFLFLITTTVLPAIQYIYPRFQTQCAYKSSQSWSFFVLSAFWLFDFSTFAGWASFDCWEVTCVYNGMGHTLSRAYELLSNSFDAFLSIYSFLADTSLDLTINADLALISDFIEGLDASRRDYIVEAIPEQLLGMLRDTSDTSLDRLQQLKGYISQYYRHEGKLKPVFNRNAEETKFKSSFERLRGRLIDRQNPHHSQTQIMLSRFLKSDVHFSNPAIRNRYTEHWVKCVNGGNDGFQEGVFEGRFGELFGRSYEYIGDMSWTNFRWEPGAYDPHLSTPHPPLNVFHTDLKSQLIGLLSNQFRTDQITVGAISNFAGLYQNLRSPYILLKDIQEWVDRMPESDLRTKARNVEQVLFWLFSTNIDLYFAMPDPDLKSFAQFCVSFYERDDISNIPDLAISSKLWLSRVVRRFQQYL